MIIDDVKAVERVISECDADVQAAWRRVVSAALYPVATSPPAGIGGAYDGALRLADHLHKIARLGQVPLPGTVGMEMLLYRWVVASEAISILLKTVMQDGQQIDGCCADCKAGGGLGDEEPDSQEEEAHDGIFQTSYCEICGAELPPYGDCVNCR